MYHSFRPGKFWYDTDGNIIQAHGGSILYAEGKYFWYGENKEGVTGRATGTKCPIWHQGVRVYSSDDLYNWKNEGIVAIDREDENSPFYPGRIMDRPHILYSQKTKKYILWAKIGGIIAKGQMFEATYFAIYESDSITDKFRLVAKRRELPAGDFDLLQCDGKAYIIFEKGLKEMLCMELDDTYTNVTSVVSSHLPKPYPPFAREAPAFFERNGEKFLLTSGTTGYFPNKSLFYKISSFHGEWTEIGEACVGDVHKNSFHTQFSSVFKHPFEKDLYIALGDRWLNDLPPDMPSPDDMFELFFNEEKQKQREPYQLERYTDENTSMATYVWLPIRFRENGIPYIIWQDEWTKGMNG